MLRNGIKHATGSALLLGLATVCAVHASAQSSQPSHIESVAAKALQIVSGIHGVWEPMPTDVVSTRMTGGALLGNGSVGVAVGGTPDKQQFYIGRDDFWSVLRGSIMPVGQLQLTIPSLHGGSSRLSENIGAADITGSFAQGNVQLRTRSWVAAEKNILFLRMENTGATPLEVRAFMLDGFGQQDRQTLGGVSGDVSWLRVSPEVVNATIGGAVSQGRPGQSAKVQSVRIFDTFQAAEHQRPLYQWSPHFAPQGGISSSGAGISNVFSCGNIIMPQRRFTVRAAIEVEHSAAEGIIFSALVEHRWMQQKAEPTDPLGNMRGQDVPRSQGAEAGLLVYLVQGRLTANLNGTVLSSDRALPVGHSVSVDVTYDGSKMVLRINGAVAGETSAFPSAAEVMGPKFDWMAAHPGDPHLPYAGTAPEGVLAMRVIGATQRQDGASSFVVPAGASVTLAVAIMDDRDDPAYFNTAISVLQHTDERMVALVQARHVDWWQKFWSRSFIEIPDKTVQSWWYGSLYVLASCSRHNNVAPGLWGNWITSPSMGWQGDYTLDYNYQAPFWAAFPTNHVELADPYDDPILAWMPRGLALAKQLQSQGVVYYTHLAPAPGWSADNFRALDQKSDALFAAVNCIQRWRYTRDAAYARKVWPFLVAVADFWTHDLKLQNGRYVDTDDAEDEHLWGPSHDRNPATVIGFLQMLYPALLDISGELNTGQGMRALWQEVSQHLSPLPLGPAASVAAIRKAVGAPIPPDRMVLLESEHGMQWVDIARGDRFSAEPPVTIQGSSAGMNSLQVVFPGWAVGLESSPELRQAAWNTVDYTRLWYDSNNTSNFYPAAASAGYDPESILRHLNLMVTHLGYPSFAYKFDAGGIENEATVPTALAAMFLQSYQQNIHVFPDWPRDQDASFGDLLAVGNFMVSSRIVKGQVEEVSMTSLNGGVFKLANPWKPDRQIRILGTDGRARFLHGTVLAVETAPAEHLVFRPLPPLAHSGSTQH